MTETLILAATAVLITALLCTTALAAWRGWLALRHAQLRKPAQHDQQPAADAGAGAGQLIELAAVKERLRRLEAIASGVEL